MNAIDFFTIYFAVGAPFAVYYFLQNRRDAAVYVLLKTAFVFLFWLVFAVSLLRRDKNHRRFRLDFLSRFPRPRQSAEEISTRQKQIENLLIKSGLHISVFDFRETAERYAGLTAAFRSDAKTDFGREIFLAARQKSDQLGAICLRRRNRNKLARHQIEARFDFLKIVEQLSDLMTDAETLQCPATEIAKILKDEAALSSLEKIFAKKRQIEETSRVEYTEKDLWNTPERKPPLAETISTRLQTAAKTTE
ncbi:MAG: hypothetical protein M3T96_05285 [Acidobacteriota bacterium]|nr:hypothetical protein [Acidobacteriota bacterium]